MLKQPFDFNIHPDISTEQPKLANRLLPYLSDTYMCQLTSHYLNQCWIIVDYWSIGNKFGENLNQSGTLFIQEN